VLYNLGRRGTEETMKRFVKIVERIVGYSILVAMIVAVVMIVGQPQTTGGNQEAFSGPTERKKSWRSSSTEHGMQSTATRTCGA
jgi:hypothetical protein